jgi:hypothetical protein
MALDRGEVGVARRTDRGQKPRREDARRRSAGLERPVAGALYFVSVEPGHSYRGNLARLFA